jgi:hypothetical protein
VGNDVLVVQPQPAPLKTVQYPNRVRGHHFGGRGEVCVQIRIGTKSARQSAQHGLGNRAPRPTRPHQPRRAPRLPSARQQCSATDLAPVNITYSPPSGGTVGTAPFTVPSVTTVGHGCVGQGLWPAGKLPCRQRSAPPSQTGRPGRPL